MNVCADCKYFEKKSRDVTNYFNRDGYKYLCKHKSSINKEYRHHITGKKSYITKYGNLTKEKYALCETINAMGECNLYVDKTGYIF
jgi:hypothetical protein